MVVMMKKNKRSGMKNLVELPCEIIELNIVPRLPIKSILRFRCVSKSWCELFRNSCFIRNQFLQFNNNNPKLMLLVNNTRKQMLSSNTCSERRVYSLEYGKKYHPHNVVEIPHSRFQFQKIWGSCDGLICVENVDFMYLWNPSTREFKLVPECPYDVPYGVDKCQTGRTTYGFGYNKIAKDFEIIQINSYFKLNQTVSSRFSIYSLRKNSWEAYKYMAPYIVHTTRKGVFVNDALHWLGYQSKSVIAFDFGDRKFRELPIPTHDENRPQHEQLHVGTINVLSLNGCLSIAVKWKQGIEAWMMKDYGVKESWTKVIEVIAPYLPYGPYSILDCFAMNIATQRMDLHVLRTYTLDEFLDKLGGCYPKVKEVITQSYSSTIYTETLVPLHEHND